LERLFQPEKKTRRETETPSHNRKRVNSLPPESEILANIVDYSASKANFSNGLLKFYDQQKKRYTNVGVITPG